MNSVNAQEQVTDETETCRITLLYLAERGETATDAFLHPKKLRTGLMLDMNFKIKAQASYAMDREFGFGKRD